MKYRASKSCRLVAIIVTGLQLFMINYYYKNQTLRIQTNTRKLTVLVSATNDTEKEDIRVFLMQYEKYCNQAFPAAPNSCPCVSPHLGKSYDCINAVDIHLTILEYADIFASRK